MKRIATHFAILSLMLVLSLTSLPTALQKGLNDFHFHLNSYEATGKVALIAIDQKSLAELNTWPWPRKYHAELIDKLTRLGATDIVFDIDFSAKTTTENDTALKDALKRAGGSVVLPVFKQIQKYSQNQSALKSTMPLKEFQDHAWLASVNIVTGRNGHVETMAYGYQLDGNFIPTIAGILSGQHAPNKADFYINYSIKAKSIPTFSYVDVLKDRINHSLIKGRKVIIGATATELGDYLYVPTQGLISGPHLQILAAETLLQNKELHQVAWWVSIFGTILIAVTLSLKVVAEKMVARLYLFAIAALGIEISAFFLHVYANTLLSTALWHMTLLAYCIASLLQEVDVRKLVEKVIKIKLENTLTMFEQVFNDSFTSIVIMNEDGKVQALSKSSLKLLNLEDESLPEDEPTNRHISEILPKELADAGLELLGNMGKENAPRHKAGITEIHHSKVNSIVLEYVITLSTMQATDGTNKKNHLICFRFQDITARQRAEEAERQASLAAIEANKAKTEFLAQISHELRTPLNSIIGFSNIIETKMRGIADNKDTFEFASEIKQNGQQLLKIVNDIIFMTKIESSSLPFNEAVCDPLDIIDQAIEQVSLQHKENELNIVSEHKNTLPMLNADFHLVTDALAEIISNAIKFSPEGEEITIIPIQDRNNNLIISVTDCGYGISENEIKNIYTPFYQVDSTATRAFEGTGLGLTKAKAFMQMHDGDIEIISSRGNGTTVHLVFPEKCIVKSKNKITQKKSGKDLVRLELSA